MEAILSCSSVSLYFLRAKGTPDSSLAAVQFEIHSHLSSLRAIPKEGPMPLAIGVAILDKAANSDE
jgi:hypothetical protein